MEKLRKRQIKEGKVVGKERSDLGINQKLKLVHDAGGYFRTPLIGLEEACAEQIAFDAERESRMAWVEVDSSAKFVAESALASVGSLRRKVRPSDQGVTEYFEISSQRRSQARACADEHGPGASARERTVRGQRFDIESHPVPVKIGDPDVRPVLILCHTGQLVKSHECVTRIRLPAIVLEHALNLLGFGSRGRGQERRVRKNRGEKDILSDGRRRSNHRV
jgi:hypothetical protein